MQKYYRFMLAMFNILYAATALAQWQLVPTGCTVSDLPGQF
jgi:hypothetical protein